MSHLTQTASQQSREPLASRLAYVELADTISQLLRSPHFAHAAGSSLVRSLERVRARLEAAARGEARLVGPED